MWVYQGTNPPARVPELPELPEKREEIIANETGQGTKAPAVQEKRRVPLAVDQSGMMMLGSYLFGTFLSGVLSAVSSTGEMEALDRYLSRWQEVFSAAGTEEVVRLFWTELLTASGALTVLLLFGLSALGALPIFGFMMLYGTGAGLLSFQLLAHGTLRAKIVYGLVSGFPTALAAGSLCLFGAAALQVSRKLQRCSFGRGPQTTGAWALLRQFARTLFWFLPICGAATGFLYLCSQCKLFG